MGIGNDNQLKLQIWDGGQWMPAGNDFWNLGDTSKPYLESFPFYLQGL
jgi:hypothetical protein